jgi:hypothetical protein
MYDFYPEWGPARHRDDREQQPQRRPRYWGAPRTTVATVTRDADPERPDDN